MKNVIYFTKEKMKNFLERFSVTKLIFILVIVSLCVFTGYYVFSNIEDKTWVIVAFLSVAMQITNYYFKDKKEKDYPDSLVDREVLDDNSKSNDKN